jgi:fermentation-respiration switch protein FrsA (DUF1100 family)
VSQPSAPDFSILDHPAVLGVLFHPRPEWQGAYRGPAHDLMIPVEKTTMVGARFHVGNADAPNLLFFHGNGEIVADYDDLGAVYNAHGLNLLAVDYRGYGRSGGRPAVSSMMSDCHRILDFASDWLAGRGMRGPLVLMGRSLGSASVLELAAAQGHRVAGLIVESGFAYAAPLLRLLGLDPERLGYTETAGFNNIEKIRRFAGPTLVIHAEFDHIIPFKDGEALCKASGARNKRLLKIPGANHNDIFMRGMPAYLAAVAELGRACVA